MKDLRHLIQKLQNNQPVRSKLRIKPLTWQTIAQTVLTSVAFELPEAEQRIKNQFAAAWARFAQDFLDEKSTQEYNSIKHGFRIRAGGFSLAMGRADTWGVPAPPERMQALGGSGFGSSFFTAERIDDPQKADKHTSDFKRHFRVRRYSRNWEPQTSFYGLHLLAISLQNILTFLKVLHGVDPTTMQFYWPTDESLFEAPWSCIPTVIGLNLDAMITKEDITPFSKEAILAAYPTDAELDMRAKTS